MSTTCNHRRRTRGHQLNQKGIAARSLTVRAGGNILLGVSIVNLLGNAREVEQRVGMHWPCPLEMQ